MKTSRLSFFFLAVLSPVLFSGAAGANPTVGPIFGTPISIDVASLNLTVSLNSDSSGWDVAFDQYEQTGQLAQYTVTSTSGDSCTAMTADVGAQEVCTLPLVNNDTTTPPTIDSVIYDPVVAMASGVLGGTDNTGGTGLADGSGTTTTTTTDLTPVNLDTTSATVTDNGDGTYTLTIPAYTDQSVSGTYTFNTTAGDTCSTDLSAGTDATCLLTPSDGQEPIITSVTWSPIVPTDIIMYAAKDASGVHVTSVPGPGVPVLWAFAIISLITTGGVLWLNSRARRRHAN
jgi:hypothetical protein